MTEYISMKGQWLGHFVYGPEFGDPFAGEIVTFRLFLDETGNGEFAGTSVDIEGIETNFEEAKVRGFLEGNTISFTKEYATYFVIDEAGNKTIDTFPTPHLSYLGEYNFNTQTFKGDWELVSDERAMGDGFLVTVSTGTWEMVKDDYEG